MSTTETISLLSDKSLEEGLLHNLHDIENDVGLGIEDFINGTNRHAVSHILSAIRALGGKDKGFAIWKEYIQHGDDVALRSIASKKHIGFVDFYRLMNETLKIAQRQKGKSTSSIGASIGRAALFLFTLAMRPVLGIQSRGDIGFRQQAVFEAFMAFRNLYEGPGATIDPRNAAIASHLKHAVEEKLISSYDELKSWEGKPLIDEAVIRGLRADIFENSVARFKRLVAQSYSKKQTAPMPSYGFTANQMPDSVKFGTEFEALTLMAEKFPQNLMKLARIFKTFNLAASAAFLPKQDRKYEDWKITLDTSVINPLYFTNRYNEENKYSTAGLEFVSPILKGPSGQAQLMTATALLTQMKCNSNETCGFHMHVSLEDTTLEQKKNLVKALRRNEEALDKLIDPARRGDGSLFARSVRHIDEAKVDAATTTEELVEIINPNNDRNFKFDMTGLVLPGAPPTLQYRAAGGAAYLNTVGDYTVILGNFTAQAFNNPDVRVEAVIEELVAQRAALKKDQTTTPVAPKMTAGL